MTFFVQSIAAFVEQISQPPIGDHERHMQFLIRERMRGMPAPNSIKSRGALLLELARELRDLRDELEERRYGSFIHFRITLNGRLKIEIFSPQKKKFRNRQGEKSLK